MLESACGAFDESDRIAAEAQALADGQGFAGETLARVHRLVNLVGRGRARDVIEPLRLARRIDPGPGVAALLIHALAAAGELEACAAELRVFTREATPTLERYPSVQANAFVVACAALRVSDPASALPLEPLLRAERGRAVTRGLMIHHGPAALALACCAALRGDAAAAHALIAEADDFARRAGAQAWIAEIERHRPWLGAA
jgi:hypothetical protein